MKQTKSSSRRRLERCVRRLFLSLACESLQWGGRFELREKVIIFRLRTEILFLKLCLFLQETRKDLRRCFFLFVAHNYFNCSNDTEPNARDEARRAKGVQHAT